MPTPFRRQLPILLLALASTSAAHAIDDYRFDGDIPLTAQTSANGFYGYGANPLLSSSLLPIGTVLDVLILPFICFKASSEETAAALAAGDPKLWRAREDAAMYLASDGEFESALLEAAFRRLRSAWHFEETSDHALARVLLTLERPGERTGEENAGRIARGLPIL